MTYSTKLICERVSPNVNSKHEFDIEEADAGRFFYAVAEIYRALGYLNEFTVKIDSPARDGGITVSFTEGCIELVEPEFDFDRAKKPAEEDDGWIEWNGGECPVPGPTKVQVKVGMGTEISGVLPARDWCWKHDGNLKDIIAYKVVEE